MILVNLEILTVYHRGRGGRALLAHDMPAGSVPDRR
jgi:hypothetical protein